MSMESRVTSLLEKRLASAGASGMASRSALRCVLTPPIKGIRIARTLMHVRVEGKKGVCMISKAGTDVVIAGTGIVGCGIAE